MFRPTSIRSLGLAIVAAISNLAPATAREPAGLRYDEIPESAYAVVAEVRARPGKESELREATLPLVSKVRAEPNNLLYFLHEDREAPGHFVFYEIFVSKADFEAHNATPHVRAWFAKLPALADGEVKTVRMEIPANQPVRSDEPSTETSK
jgi:quinol monooxygenase YgiN